MLPILGVSHEVPSLQDYPRELMEQCRSEQVNNKCVLDCNIMDSNEEGKKKREKNA